MLERIRRPWRRQMNADKFKSALLELYASDAEMRPALDAIGVNPEMLRNPEFDLRSFLSNRNFMVAMTKATHSAEGRALLAKARELKPGSDDLVRTTDELVKRFGSKLIESLLRSIPS